MVKNKKKMVEKQKKMVEKQKNGRKTKKIFSIINSFLCLE